MSFKAAFSTAFKPIIILQPGSVEEYSNDQINSEISEIESLFYSNHINEALYRLSHFLNIGGSYVSYKPIFQFYFSQKNLLYIQPILICLSKIFKSNNGQEFITSELLFSIFSFLSEVQFDIYKSALFCLCQLTKFSFQFSKNCLRCNFHQMVLHSFTIIPDTSFCIQLSKFTRNIII
jgi:hypothetical protein